jgi:nucleotide-binding universal stress UspA family protein
MKSTELPHTNVAEPATNVRANRRILVPLEFTADTHTVLEYAAGLVKEESASICLLHVVDFEPFKSAMTESPLFHSAAHIISRAERYLRMLAHHHLPPDCPIRILVRAGKTAREVVKVAHSICADVIILNAPPKNLLARWLLGDPTRWIESHAPCSVVVLREANYGACDCSSEFEARHAPNAATPA